MNRLLTVSAAIIFMTAGVGSRAQDGALHATHTHESTHSAAQSTPPVSAATPAPVAVNVSQCWVRLMPNTLPMAAYFTVSNSSATPIDLVNIDTAAFAHSMLHRTERKGGMADMTMVERWPIPAKGSVQAAPGGYHAMLEKPVKPLVIGSEIPLTFTFSGNRTVSVPCRINPASALGY